MASTTPGAATLRTPSLLRAAVSLLGVVAIVALFIFGLEASLHRALAGRETLEGHDVLRIEYYPTRLFSDNEPDKQGAGQDTARDRERMGKFDKTSLVTMWVDPEEYQIVKFTFENVGFDFLPARWLVRVEDMRASMVMSQPFDGVWLPKGITIQGGVTSAYGSLSVAYTRAFSNYAQAEVGARIRSYGPPRD